MVDKKCYANDKRAEGWEIRRRRELSTSVSFSQWVVVNNQERGDIFLIQDLGCNGENR